MLFEHCRAIHTVGMDAAITVAFLDSSCRVISVKRTAPGRPWVVDLRARHVLETGFDEDLIVGDRFDHKPRRRAMSRRWIADVPE
jgi:hypothetical protein